MARKIAFYRKYPLDEQEVNQGDLFKLSIEEIKEYLDISSPPQAETFIVLSNSCDLCHGAIQNVCLARVTSIKELVKKNNLNKDAVKTLAKNCSKYNDKVYFFLPTKRRILFSSIVKLDISNTYSFSRLKEIIIKNRIAGLNTPYREKLGWAVGNLFNRVALEHDEKTFEKQIIDCC